MKKEWILFQYAQSKKVTITSPGNLLLVVGVIKEFMKVVTIGENQSQIISILEKLQIEWDKYTFRTGKIERALKTASVAQDHLMGRRKKALDNQFKAVHQLENQLDQNPEKAIDIEALQEEIEEEILFDSELEKSDENDKQMSFDN